MTQLGGNSMFLSPRDTQLGRGEPIEDTGCVLSRMVDAIVVRTHAHEQVEILAKHSQVPVINALTDMYHPCQLLADMQTWVEHRGEVGGPIVSHSHQNSVGYVFQDTLSDREVVLHVALPSECSFSRVTHYTDNLGAWCNV